MYNSKKAQISDTMSWIVATIIIVLILSIPILLVTFGVLKNNVISFQRSQDPIVTKSISGYLLQNYGFVFEKEIFQEKVSAPKLDVSVSSFLFSLTRNENIEGWNLVVDIDDKSIYSKTYFKGGWGLGVFQTPFYFNENNKKVVFKFSISQVK